MSVHSDPPEHSSSIIHNTWDGVHVFYEQGQGSERTIRTPDDADLVDLGEMR